MTIKNLPKLVVAFFILLSHKAISADSQNLHSKYIQFIAESRVEDLFASGSQGELVTLKGTIAGLTDDEINSGKFSITRADFIANETKAFKPNAKGEFELSWKKTFTLERPYIELPSGQSFNPVLKNGLEVKINVHDDTVKVDFYGKDAEFNQEILDAETRYEDSFEGKWAERHKALDEQLKLYTSAWKEKRKYKIPDEVLNVQIGELNELLLSSLETIENVEHEEAKQFLAHKIYAKYLRSILGYAIFRDEKTDNELIKPLIDYIPKAATYQQFYTYSSVFSRLYGIARRELPYGELENVSLELHQKALRVLDNDSLYTLYNEWLKLHEEFLTSSADDGEHFKKLKKDLREARKKFESKGFKLVSRFSYSLYLTTKDFNHPSQSKLELTRLARLKPNNLAYYIAALEIAYDKTTYQPLKKYFQNKLEIAKIEWAALKSKTASSSRMNKENPNYKVHTYPALTPENLIKELLNEHKGKALFLDFWGEWCIPCIEDIPDIKNLKSELTDDPFAFVYISVNTSQEKLKKAIIRYDLQGHHVWLPKTQEQELMKHFGASGVPFYVVLDADGNIILKVEGTIGHKIRQKMAEKLRREVTKTKNAVLEK